MLYTTTFRSQVSKAVDYYLEMENLIEANIQQELGLTDLTSRMRNMCPPCTYKVSCPNTITSPAESYRCRERKGSNSLSSLQWMEMSPNGGLPVMVLTHVAIIVLYISQRMLSRPLPTRLRLQKRRKRYVFIGA
jgi:hypothetical protein